MLCKRIIPCLDIDKGRVVKGVNFVDLVDAGDPVETAKAYDRIGADEIVFLDITASCENRATAYDIIRRASEQVFIPLTVGGGIRTAEDFRAMLSAGADKIAVNSAAIGNPSLKRRRNSARNAWFWLWTRRKTKWAAGTCTATAAA